MQSLKLSSDFSRLVPTSVTTCCTRAALWLISCCGVVAFSGCGDAAQSALPVTREQVAEIKAGMTLAEIEAKLGPSYPATRAQTARLNEMTSRMPAQIRESAMNGTDRAWGNEQGWLAGRMNEKNQVWMLSNQFGGPPPPRPNH